MSLISSPSHFGKNPSSFSFYTKVTTLPKITHPSKLIENEQNHSSLDIRGQSKLSRTNSSLSNYDQIPENIDVTIGQDRSQVRLPIFGRRPSTNCSVNEIDEFSSILKEKVRLQENDIRIKFRHSIDFDSNGKISLQALKHIIASIFGTQKQISPNQIEKLLEKFHLNHITKISFDEFLHCLSNERQQTNRTIKSSSQSYLTKRTAGQIFIILKDKARTKSEDLVRFCPSLNGGIPTKIFKSQFQNFIIDMGYRMVDKEFDKLWNKFDPDGFQLINSEKFIKKLTNEHFLIETCSTSRSETQDQQTAILKASFMDSQQNSNDQLDENQIQKWFKQKLPQCIDELEHSLKELDQFNSGQISSQLFLQQLKQFGLILEENLLEYFLKRLNIQSTLNNQRIHYPDVIKAFKQKIDLTKKRKKLENPLSSEEIRQSSLEKQVEYLISLNYDKILDKMRSFDKKQTGTIENNEMRSLIEDLLEFPLRHDEYEELHKHFPKNDYGKINYLIYLKQIKDHCHSLHSIKEEQEEEQTNRSEKIPQWDYMRSTNIRESLKQEHYNEKKLSKENHINENNSKENPRSIQQLNQILKTLIQTQCKDIEEEFNKIDYCSYRELTQEYLYRLLKRFPSIKPEISFKEIQLIWSQCHLKESGKLDFDEFLRQFGYSKASAHYPNAKQNPPTKGDRDFLLTSNKLYGDTILVHDTTRHMIKTNWENLRREFVQIDPYRTGFVHSEEFDEIIIEFCPSIVQQDLDLLKKDYQNINDSRINYIQFLKQYSPNNEFFHEIDQRTKRPLTTVNENIIRNASERSNINDISIKIRRKLSHSYKQIRRSFKQEDITNCGSISIKPFKDILNEYKCSLNDEEFYILISQLDTKMNGTINYNHFLQQYLKDI
ncbi:hypothetical protein I4U23_027637 [Adineta vaga]|nr:hypothetical protein I4U23_027637 [Adineta vaga]